MSKQKMLAARELIKEKRYDEARHILQEVNHPKAREWIKKLDGILSARKVHQQGVFPFDSHVDQNFLITDAVLESPKVNEARLSALMNFQQQAIAEDIRDATSNLMVNPQNIALLRPHSFLTEGIGGEEYAIAISGPILFRPDTGSSWWRTVICLPEEIDLARADLSKHCMPEPPVTITTQKGDITIALGDKVVVNKPFLDWSRDTYGRESVLEIGEELRVIKTHSRVHDLDAVVAVSKWNIYIAFPLKFVDRIISDD